MSNRSLWSEEEIRKLRILYISGASFDEIEKELPTRSSNAIRQKASRLGIRRPAAFDTASSSQNVLRISNGNGDVDDYIFRCGGCGNWIHANLNGKGEDRTIICSQCQTTLRYVA